MTQNKTLIEKDDFYTYTGMANAIFDWGSNNGYTFVDSEIQDLITALQSEQAGVDAQNQPKMSNKEACHSNVDSKAGVNKELLEALRFYANPENYCEDYEVNFPFRDTKINFDKGSKAAIALANAESCKPDHIGDTNKMVDPRDEQIRILREGIERIQNHSMCSDQTLQRRAEVVAICEDVLAAADKLTETAPSIPVGDGQCNAVSTKLEEDNPCS